ncbi:MAG: rRNA pseudouridine synthase [Deltaproteobacteria bacterium]|nr:rRNA pseudouridine synthase [Deltaproteobacteria bacterium]
MTDPPSGERLNRFIARSGVASRREADRLVQAGQVTVNGQVVRNPATSVDPERDHVKVRGRLVPRPHPPVYYLLYKPKGVLTTRKDPEGRLCVQDLLPPLPCRVEPVGRLDFNTEGALLLTNDGELARRLAHPRWAVPRKYHAKVWRTPTEKTLDKIRAGIHLEDGRTVPAKCRLTGETDKGNAWVEITVAEGRNRLIRRLFTALGHPVSKLTRVSFAGISIRGMERGQLRPLTGLEVQRLRRLVSDEGSPGGRGSRPAGWARPKARGRRHGPSRA